MISLYKDLKNVPQINCNIDLLKSMFNLKDNEYFHTILDKENDIWLSEEFENWLARFNLSIKRIEIFHTEPLKTTGWHIDMNPPSDYVKINWVYEKGISYMEWGEEHFNSLPETKITMAGTSYLRLQSDAVDMMCSHHLQGPTLVNVGYPHRVVNEKNSDRWCLSAIVWNKKNNSRLLWDDALKLLENYLI